ncbi:MAG: rod shape-determining protein MreC [Parcubacteria group bacterium]|nr:rod shape-determining protein MreC [Parcubacteria group bacterium]
MSLARKLRLSFILLTIGAVLTGATLLGVMRPLEGMVGRIAAPLERSFTAIALASREVISDLARIRDLKHDNQALATKVRELTRMVSELSAVRRENTELRNQLGLREKTQRDVLRASVTVARVDDQQGFVSIDRGNDAGISVGDGVVTSDGIFVGTVSEVTEVRSLVRLLSAPGSAVAGETLPGGITGIVRGGLSQGLSFDEVPNEETLEPGMVVVTLGDPEGIPSDLPIGEIERIFREPTKLFQSALVAPLVDSHTLRTVFVIRTLGPATQDP